jgi:hypothetical protein
LRGEEQVAGLQVSVQHVVGVKIFEGKKQLRSPQQQQVLLKSLALTPKIAAGVSCCTLGVMHTGHPYLLLGDDLCEIALLSITVNNVYCVSIRGPVLNVGCNIGMLKTTDKLYLKPRRLPLPVGSGSIAIITSRTQRPALTRTFV